MAPHPAPQDPATVKLSIVCRHCHERRVWEQTPTGEIVPTTVDGPRGLQAYAYTCAVNPAPGHACEPVPVPTSGERMVAELGAMSRRRWGGGMGSGAGKRKR